MAANYVCSHVHNSPVTTEGGGPQPDEGLRDAYFKLS